MSRIPSQAELRLAEAATWGSRPSAAPNSSSLPTIRLREWRALIKGPLRGFATVELACGLIIRDCPVFDSAKGCGASLPRKPKLNRERRQQIGADGKPAFDIILEWRDNALNDQFSADVVALIRDVHPEAFNAS